MPTLNRKNVITLVIIILLLLVIPFLMRLIQEQQKLRSRAAAAPIVFQGPNVSIANDKQVFRLDDKGEPTVGLTLTSPFGPGSSSSPSTPVSPGQPTISGQVFFDNDDNGTFSSGDQAVAGTLLFVFKEAGPNSDSPYLSTGETDSNGNFQLNSSKLVTGEYTISAAHIFSESTLTTKFSFNGSSKIINMPLKNGQNITQ